MIPLRFKAVCTETGREFGVNDLLCNGPMKDKCDFVIEPIIGLEYSIEFEGVHESKNIELCQSTGLHDANGQEVFFGDAVILNCTCCKNTEVHFVDFQYGEIVFSPIDGSRSRNGHLNKLTIIGNRWQPQFKK